MGANFMIRFTIPLLFLVAAAPAVAQVGVVNPATAANGKAAKRVICKDIGEIGSRLASKRICMTAQQWEEQERRDREDAADQQRRSTIPD
jgi:hypothetical protein